MSAVSSAPRAAPASTGAWTLVCQRNDLLPGTGVAALVKGEPVAVFRLRDERLFALGNIDPFSNASVLSRGILGDVEGQPVVASPIFKQHFRLDDGVCIEDDGVSVATYRVTVIDHAIYVQPRLS